MKISIILKEIERRLQRHPGDAPWSCVECYYSRPCIERQILLAAKRELTDKKGIES